MKKYNKDDNTAYLFLVGNGSGDDDRSNIFEVSDATDNCNGELWINNPDGTSIGGLVLSNSKYGGEIIFSTKNDPNDVGSIGADSSGNIVINSRTHYNGAIYNTTDYTFAPNGAFSINGRDICENKVLWYGAWYMSEDHTAYLDESVNDQPNGIVLVFSAYSAGSNEPVKDYHWCTFFVPKYLISYSYIGFNCPLISNTFRNVACKYIYISDTAITGHEDNVSDGLASGISYNNRQYVLRYVIGV